MTGLRRICGLLLVLIVGFASNVHAWSDGDVNGDPGSLPVSSDANGDGQDDSTAVIDLFYLHERFYLAAPLLELGKAGFAPAANQASQNVSTPVFPRPLPFLPAAVVFGAHAGLRPRAPSLV